MSDYIDIIINSKRFGPWAYRVNVKHDGSPLDEWGEFSAAVSKIEKEARDHLYENLEEARRNERSKK